MLAPLVFLQPLEPHRPWYFIAEDGTQQIGGFVKSFKNLSFATVKVKFFNALADSALIDDVCIPCARFSGRFPARAYIFPCERYCWHNRHGIPQNNVTD